MNSTPPRPTYTIPFTALLPPPPTPITLIFAPRRAAGSSVNRSFSASPLSKWSIRVLRRPSEEFLENPAQAPGHLPPGAAAAPSRLGGAVTVRVQHDADRRRKHRTAHVVREAANSRRAAAADRQVED